MIIRNDCRFFRGDIPCIKHKEFGCRCDHCEYFQKISDKILIIKLGAIGDVIRTTPILRKIKQENPNAYIHWLTYTPEVLSRNWVDNILKVSIESIELLKNIEFDWLINLDKDPLAISLTNQIKSKRKSGFTIDEYGHAKPISNDAEKHKWLTGLFDDLNKLNSKHYIEEIFDICGFNFNNEEYILETNGKVKLDFKLDHSKKIVGLNTGCGSRWPSRLWPTEYWTSLAKDLLKNDFEVLLLGGEQEHEKNALISQQSGAKYFGHFPLSEFIYLLNECNSIVTAVSMSMHLAIGLKKELILFNNIFNKNEFYLYDRGLILEPDFDCDCYYSPVCPNNCMQYLLPEKVFNYFLNVK